MKLICMLLLSLVMAGCCRGRTHQQQLEIMRLQGELDQERKKIPKKSEHRVDLNFNKKEKE